MIATTVEQSKKLAEILPIESADMWYPGDVEDDIECGFGDVQQELYIEYGDGHPAWSLAALLSVLPKCIGDSILRMDMGENDFNLWFDDLTGIVDILLPDITKDNPVDACYEMIIKLHEQKLL